LKGDCTGFQNTKTFTGEKKMEIFNKIADEVQKGNSGQTEELIREALAQNIAAEDILYQGLVEGMNIISEKYRNNECFIPEVLISAKAMSLGLEKLNPLLGAANIKSQGKVVIGTIQGDLHDIGKNIVAMLLQGAGFEVVDLGADVPIEKFLDSAEKEEADIVGMSALLTTTMINMKAVIEGLKSRSFKKPVKVIIGGAPVTQDFADRINADGYAADAASAVDMTKNLMQR
jgi:5-methyltetrahydrofolate--homocysteine methyltransferase